MASLGARREGRYGQGYEPSAPPLATEREYPEHTSSPHATTSYPRSSPYQDPDYSPYAPPPQREYGAHHERGPNSRFDRDPTLGEYVANSIGDVFKGLWRHSHTILRIDLRKAIRYDGPPVQRSQRGARRSPYGQPRGTSVSPGGPFYGGEPNGYYEGEEGYETSRQSRGWLNGIEGGGARLKLMQVWDFKNEETGGARLPWNLNFGFGANLVMDQGQIEPKLRIRAKHVALHALPEPLLELRGKWPLGNTNLAIKACYRVPFSRIGKIWESNSAQLRINLFHPSGTGIHFTPGGVEFDEQVIHIGQFTTMRVAAALDFPRQFPLEEGEQPLKLRITRLGLKSRIL